MRGQSKRNKQPFTSSREFILYELTYIPFFIAIEFIFRGYLLFGLAGIKKEEVKENNNLPGIFYFNRYALLIPMLSYTAWHLGKPVPELWGTLVWGLAAGAAIYAIRSIWPIVLAHWLLNVFMDASLINLF
jgi:membrane protease YdiL (CAAX protease family)